jgi:hypothetical protein
VVDQFFNQEAEYAAYLAEAPAFVCNGLDMGAEYHRVHYAHCNSLNRAGPASTGLHTSVRKACSRDLNDLVAWLEANHGGASVGYQFCAFCFKP